MSEKKPLNEGLMKTLQKGLNKPTPQSTMRPVAPPPPPQPANEVSEKK